MKYSVKDKAIILRRKPFGEADIMLTLYGEKSGKVRALAKGARRITSKLLGYTESFTVISCQFDFRSSIPIVSQVAHEQLFDGIAANQQLYERLHILAELMDRGCQEEESNPQLYYLLRDGITDLVMNNSPLLLSWLILRLSRSFGVAPQLLTCAHCDTPLAADQALAWSEVHGGIITCASVVQGGMTLSLEEAKLLRHLDRSSRREIEKLKVAQTLVAKIESMLIGHLQYVLEQDLVAFRVVRGMQHAHVD